VNSYFNHLDHRLRSKLAPGSPEAEIGILNHHMTAAATLLPRALQLCEAHGRPAT